MENIVSAIFAVVAIFWKILNAPITTLVLLVYVSNRLYRVERMIKGLRGELPWADPDATTIQTERNIKRLEDRDA